MFAKILSATQYPQNTQEIDDSALAATASYVAPESKLKRKLSSMDDTFERPRKDTKLDPHPQGHVTPLDPSMTSSVGRPSADQITEALCKKFGLNWWTSGSPKESNE